jgi:hypothetical protein
MKRTFPTCMLALLLVGCAHSVGYKLTENDRWKGPRIDKVLVVQPFKDQTVPLTNKVETVVRDEWHTNKVGAVRSPKDNAISAGTNVVHRKVTDEWRTNYRQGYKDKDLGRAVASMTAKHLAYSGLFTKVVFGTNTASDYVLSGSLAEYSARALANSTAEGIQAGTAGFGLIGAIVGSASTAGMKTEVRVAAKIDDLNLTTISGKSLWRNSLGTSTNFNAHFSQAGSSIVFRHPDDALKRIVTDLIRELGNSSLTNNTKRVAER